MKVSVKRLNDNYLLEGSNKDGNTVLYDASPAIGGTGGGIRPMEGVLTSLASCSSMDVLSILKKQKQNPDEFSVEVEAERADEHPKVFTKIQLTFRINGSVDDSKALRAIRLSMDKYCSVTKMLESTAVITTTLVLNGNTVSNESAS